VVTRLGPGFGDIVVPALALRVLAGLLVVLVVGAPWLAWWAGLFAVEAGATEVERVRLRPELMVVPSGRFLMGSPADEAGRAEDEAQREVEVGAFALCRTEVTNAQWKAVMGELPGACEGCEDEQPVRGVTWEQATAYLNRLTERENELLAETGGAPRTRCYEGGKAVPGCTGYRLPTEAEWEYSARAGTRTAYSFGGDPRKLCQFGNGADKAAQREHPDWAVNDCDDGVAGLAAVGRFKMNRWGLFDVHGNVAEWVAAEAGAKLRGGSFRDSPAALSAATGEDAGLRCARDAAPAELPPPTDPTCREPGQRFAAGSEQRPGLVCIPGGSFTMGSPAEEKDRSESELQHPASVDGFVMCETEVTQAQYEAVMGEKPSDCEYGCGGDLPVQNVSWNDACAYMEKLTARENEARAKWRQPALTPCYEKQGETWAWKDHGCTGYRLPTESEWEYAARAGTGTAYFFGETDANLGDYAWFDGNAGGKVHPVGTKKRNPWGLFDIYGNVWEWCWDWYAEYKAAPKKNDFGPENGVDRVLRGGSAWYGPRDLRSAGRRRLAPTDRSGNLGFRCVRAPRPSVEP
jgi:formylglycine-generating enzyme required for sulfatase activity